MKKLIIFTLCLVSLLYINENNLHAEDTIINNLDEYISAISNSNIAEIKLGADIDVTPITAGSNWDEIHVSSNRILDLNGHTITTESSKLKIFYSGDYKLTIKDSSLDNTGKILATGSYLNGCPISVESVDNTDSTLVLKDITVESTNDIGVREMIYIFLPEIGYKHYLEIDGAKFINADQVFQHNDTNDKISINIKTMTTTDVSFLNHYKTFKISDILNPLYSRLKVGSTIISDVDTYISDYDISAGLEVYLKNHFDISDIEFNDKEIGYSSIDAKPISITCISLIPLKIKEVTVDNPSKFTVLGSSTPTLEDGTTDNTSFSIKPVDGLPIGTHTATITVVKEVEEVPYMANVTFTVTKAKISPSVSISNWTYGDTASTPSVNGNTEDGEVTFEYKLKDASDSTYTSTIPTNAGEYTLRATIEETTNYSAAVTTTDFTINKKVYADTIPYTLNVKESLSKSYSINIEDLELPSVFTNVKMVNYSGQTNVNNIFETLSINAAKDNFIITTNSVSGGKSDNVNLLISSNNYENKIIYITVTTISKEVITISGLTYTNKGYDKNPIVASGELSHAGYSGIIDILYESTDSKGYSSTTAPTNAGNYKVTYSIPTTNEDCKGNVVYTFNILKAVPACEAPTNIECMAGDELSTISLPSNFEWNNKTTIMTSGNNTCSATYTPEDTDNYSSLDNVVIIVYGKSEYTITTSVDGGNGTISDGSKVIESTNNEITFTPATGYMINTVKVNDEIVIVTNNKYTISNITENKNIIVSYKKITFTITFNSLSNITITPNETTNVEYGDNKDIIIKANLGYKLTSVKINNVENLPLTDHKISLTNITENKNIVITVEKIIYNFTTGENQKIVIGKKENAVFKINADKSLFNKIYVNDDELSSDLYTVTEGSTIITINYSYLNTLKAGSYDLKAVFNDGAEVTTAFVIEKGKKSNNSTPIVLSILFGSIALIGLSGGGFYLKKKRK